MEEPVPDRQYRAEVAGSIYLDLVDFAASVPPVPVGWHSGAAGTAANH